MTTSTHRPIALEHLADVLWHERNLLEELLFRAITVRLMLAADERRYVSAAANEVESVIERLAAAEQSREDAVALAATVLGTDPHTLSLQLLARQAPAPLDLVFRDHERAFAALVDEIQEVVSTNARLATSTLGYIDRSLHLLDDAPTTMYGGDGRSSVTRTATGVRLDQRA